MPHEGLLDSKNSAKEAIHVAANRSVRPYSTNQEYLYAMREDLADWLKASSFMVQKLLFLIIWQVVL